MRVMTQAKGNPRTLAAGHDKESDPAGDDIGRLETNVSAYGVELVNLGADTTFTAPIFPRWIRATGAGVIKVDAYDRTGTTQAGILLPILAGEKQDIGCITKIYSTGNGTTATGLTIGF